MATSNASADKQKLAQTKTEFNNEMSIVIDYLNKAITNAGEDVYNIEGATSTPLEILNKIKDRMDRFDTDFQNAYSRALSKIENDK